MKCASMSQEIQVGRGYANGKHLPKGFDLKYCSEKDLALPSPHPTQQFTNLCFLFRIELLASNHTTQL